MNPRSYRASSHFLDNFMTSLRSRCLFPQLSFLENVATYKLTFFLKPKYAPMKVSGTDMQNQRAKIATSVPKGMAADDPSPQRIRFMMKKSANTILKDTKDMSKQSWEQKRNNRATFVLQNTDCVSLT